MLTLLIILSIIALIIYGWLKAHDLEDRKLALWLAQQERLKRQDERASLARRTVEYMNRRS